MWYCNITHFNLTLINPQHACAVRAMVLGLCVCVSVCLCEIWHYRHRVGIRAIVIHTVSARQARENVFVASAKLTAFDLEKPPGSKYWLRDPGH